MSLTVPDLIHIAAGLDNTEHELRCLEAADKHVTAYLKRGCGTFFSGDNEHHQTIGRIAQAVDSESWNRLQGQIGALDKFIAQHESAATFRPIAASEAIAETLSQTNRAAYYFGMAMALRIMGGAR